MTTTSQPRRSRVGRRRHVLVIGAVMALLISLPAVPVADGQDNESLPSRSEQQQAARDLLTQLDSIDGPVDLTQLTIDPALGPPPWTSFVPDRDPAAIAAWNELSTRLGNAKVGDPSSSARALPFGIAVEDLEGVNETGINDTLATGQFVNGFGTAAGEEGFARVLGTLGSPPPPPPEPDCPSAEEDGSIPDANATPIAAPDIDAALCGGVIGDGAFGASSGDVDFFDVNEVSAGSLIIADAGSFDPTAVFSVTTAVYTADGTLLGSLDDSDSSPDSVLVVTAPNDGTYYVAVSGVGALPSDPFDPATGTGVTFTGDYLVALQVAAPPPPPCLAVEPDSTISEANVLPFGPGEVTRCDGLLGDGAFGASTGDFDFFALDVGAGSDMIVDIISPDGLSATATTIAVYDEFGTLLAVLDDDGVDPANFLRVPIAATGVYYALVSSPGVLPSDPFDASSGTIAGPPTPYGVFVLSIPGSAPPPPGGPTPTPPPPPAPIPFSPGADDAAVMALISNAQDQRTQEIAAFGPLGFAALDGPCVSTEDDGAIGLANDGNVDAGATIECTGTIGDGPHGLTTGDTDIYEVTVGAGEALIVDIDTNDLGDLDSFLAVFAADGTLVASNDDFDGLDSRVDLPVPAAGTYYVAVFSFGSTPTDPFDSGSGSGAESTGPYVLTISRVDFVVSDVDVYLIDLDVGDAMSAGFAMTGSVTIIDPTGRVGMQSAGSASFIYPASNPLRHLGNVGADFVAKVPGMHAVVLADGPGAYDGELRVKRSALTDRPGDDVQTIFLDFDGGQFNDAIFDGRPNSTGTLRTLSPLVNWLPRWGLNTSDEDAVITSIIASFTEDVLIDLQNSNINGNRDATGIGGELDLQILNSRDHDDPWGRPNVSRIIIGGSIAESGIPTIGIAQSIDPGNFDTEETAIVLLDVLSDPAGANSATLNNFGVQAPTTVVDLVGHAVGIITAHEAGHFLGNWHTASFNGVPNVMDEGGDILTTLGLGADQTLGTSDDVDTDFVIDEFSFREGFAGFEDTAVRTAQALSTGQTNVAVVSGVPTDGVYTLQNVGSSRFLDGNQDRSVSTSANPANGNNWELSDLGAGVYSLRNAEFGTYLDGDGDGTVDLSVRLSNDDHWELIPTGDGSFYLLNVVRGRYLSQASGVSLRTQQRASERWVLSPVEPIDVDSLVGTTITLLNHGTGRWLDGDRDGTVDQSLRLGSDNSWSVLNAGNGYVYLQNVVTNGYLAGRFDNNVDMSTALSTPNRWQLTGTPDALQLHNVDFGGYLAAERAASGFDAVLAPEQSLSTQWVVD